MRSETKESDCPEPTQDTGESRSVRQPPQPQQPARSGFGQNLRPRRRLASSKAVVFSPEARRIAEERNRAMVEEYISQKGVKKYPARWAGGAVPSSGMYGTPDT